MCRDLNVEGGRHDRGFVGLNEIESMAADPPPRAVDVDQLMNKREVRMVFMTLTFSFIHNTANS